MYFLLNFSIKFVKYYHKKNILQNAQNEKKNYFNSTTINEYYLLRTDWY